MAHQFSASWANGVAGGIRIPNTVDLSHVHLPVVLRRQSKWCRVPRIKLATSPLQKVRSITELTRRSFVAELHGWPTRYEGVALLAELTKHDWYERSVLHRQTPVFETDRYAFPSRSHEVVAGPGHAPGETRL